MDRSRNMASARSLSLAEWCSGVAGYLSTFDDKDRLVVDEVGIAALFESIILPDRMIQQRIADLLRRLAIVIAHDHFQQLTIMFVAAVVNPVGIEN